MYLLTSTIHLSVRVSKFSHVCLKKNTILQNQCSKLHSRVLTPFEGRQSCFHITYDVIYYKKNPKLIIRNIRSIRSQQNVIRAAQSSFEHHSA